MKLKVYTLSSFAKSIEGGNPAGVVLHADDLSEQAMKKVAGIVGFSETAFVMKSDKADFKVRFFTPVEEVDICGHATIATFSILLRKGYIKQGIYSQETKAGVLCVEVMEDATIMMHQNPPGYYEIISKREIADTLNIDETDMIEELPIQIVSTGIRDIMIPIKSIDMLNAIKPDFEKVSKLCRTYNTVGYHMFTFETLYHSNVYCRNLAPLFGIPEESATGASNGALACYLLKYDKIKSEDAAHIVIEQGYSMGKPSEIIGELIMEDNKLVGVKVGGNTMNMSKMEVEL